MRIVVLQIPSPEAIAIKKDELSRLRTQAELLAKAIAKLDDELRTIEVSQELAKMDPQRLAAFGSSPAPDAEWLWREQWAEKGGFWTPHGHTARKILGFR